MLQRAKNEALTRKRLRSFAPRPLTNPPYLPEARRASAPFVSAMSLALVLAAPRQLVSSQQTATGQLPQTPVATAQVLGKRCLCYSSVELFQPDSVHCLPPTLPPFRCEATSGPSPLVRGAVSELADAHHPHRAFGP
jgi:hypothetical protein